MNSAVINPTSDPVKVPPHVTMLAGIFFANVSREKRSQFRSVAGEGTDRKAEGSGCWTGGQRKYRHSSQRVAPEKNGGAPIKIEISPAVPPLPPPLISVLTDRRCRTAASSGQQLRYRQCRCSVFSVRPIGLPVQPPAASRREGQSTVLTPRRAPTRIHMTTTLRIATTAPLYHYHQRHQFFLRNVTFEVRNVTNRYTLTLPNAHTTAPRDAHHALPPPHTLLSGASRLPLDRRAVSGDT